MLVQVQPIPGFGNFMGQQHVDEKQGTENKKKHDDISVAVYQVYSLLTVY
jgi:hypothetical protein